MNACGAALFLLAVAASAGSSRVVTTRRQCKCHPHHDAIYSEDGTWISSILMEQRRRERRSALILCVGIITLITIGASYAVVVLP